MVENGIQGLLFDPENPLDLSIKLDMLLKNNVLRNQLGKEGTLRAIKFSWKTIASNILSYYEETRHEWLRRYRAS